MLIKQYPKPVKFFAGFIYSEEQVYLKSRNILRRKFGAIDFESDKISFDFTAYYKQEMGEGLIRRFISFERIISPDKLRGIKLFCIHLEKKFSYSGKRKINIDPGYLNEAKLVLSTTKDFSHRIYLGKGVFAEVTLCYKDRDFRGFETTYPDYQTPRYKEIFLSMRKRYREQLKNDSKR